jgi:bifunctional DNA-binding transcriptional regulator/antitoxin component of YhaV-PrlF toxin-antitoxin module
MNFCLTITTKRQTTLPKEFMDALGLVPGKKVMVEICSKKNKLIQIKDRREKIENIFGLIKVSKHVNTNKGE